MDSFHRLGPTAPDRGGVRRRLLYLDARIPSPVDLGHHILTTGYLHSSVAAWSIGFRSESRSTASANRRICSTSSGSVLS